MGGAGGNDLPTLFCFWEDAGAGGEGLSLERDIQVLWLLLGGSGGLGHLWAQGWWSCS